MANYPKEFEDLLQEYLTDGIITAQERKVLLNKAAKLGLDVDEIDLYIDAQQQKADQQVDAAVRKQRGQSCPFCGGSVPQLADKCPHCGQHISAEASDELKEVIENLEEALVDFKSGKDFARSKANVEKYMRKAQLYYSSNPKIQTLIEQVKQESEIAEKKAKSEATKKTLIKILTYNKWITAIGILILIMAIWSGISSLKSSLTGPDPADDPKAAIEAINNAIEKNDLAKAEGFYSAYKERHGSRDIKTAANKLAKAFIKNGDYEAAKGMVHKSYASSVDDLNWLVQDELIKAGEYQMAEDCVDWWGTTDEHYSFICKCVDQMKENGDSKEKIKSFIDRTTARYTSSLTSKTEWQQPAVQQRLYEYAGIK